jgi:hypothetical protein
MLPWIGAILSAGLTAASPSAMPRSTLGLSIPGVQRNGPSVLQIPQRALHLEPITAQELLSDPIESLGSTVVTATGNSTSMEADAAIPLPPLPSVVHRTLRGVWRMSVSVGSTQRSPDVSVLLEGTDGTPGALISDSATGTALPIGVRKLPPRTVSLIQDAQIIEGDVILEIPVAAIAEGGRFRGRLVIRVEGY